MLGLDIGILLSDTVGSLVDGTVRLQVAFLSTDKALFGSHHIVLLCHIGTLLSPNYLTGMQQLIPQENESLIAGSLREDISCVESCVNFRQLELPIGNPLPDPMVSDVDVLRTFVQSSGLA